MTEHVRAPHPVGCMCLDCGDKADQARDDAAAAEGEAELDRQVFSGEYPWGPPSEKAPEMSEFLELGFGRTTSIKAGVCVPAPLGCGKTIEGFKDALSHKEYGISGLCQKCQDEVFG